MRTKKSGRSYINVSISFPPETLALARERAEKLGLPFSTYIQKCVQRDLEERGTIVFAERDERILAVAEDPAPLPPSISAKTSKRKRTGG